MNKKPDMPVKVPVPPCNGYPNNVAKTQTMKIRGAGAATKGTNFNPNCC
jgi:hypothetical protein